MNDAFISCKNLSFSYDKTQVLIDASFTIYPNEFIAIFGPNGGGKTTLVKLILGFLNPSKGTLSLFNKSPEKTRHLVGYVPQRLHFDPHFPISLMDVVLMGALDRLTAWGRIPKEVLTLLDEALERVCLSHKKQAPFSSLSGGEMQKALIARAILNKPKLLILDEPTAHIDDAGEQSIHALLQELKQEMSILMVTHDLQTILDKVGRLLCVQKTVQSLQPQEICEHFALGLYHTPLSSSLHFKKTKGPN